MESKKIKIRNLEFLQAKIGMIPAINELAAIRTSPDIKLAVIKTTRNVKDGFEAYAEARTSIQEQYCMKDEKGKPVIDQKNNKYKFDTPEIEENCTKEIIELANVEVEIEIYPISEGVLIQNENVTANLLLRLGDFIIK